MAVQCLDCGAVEPEERLSISGPIKEIDDDGRLIQQWIHVCRHCFSDKLRPDGTGND